MLLIQKMPSGYKLNFSLPINNFLPLIFSNLSIKLSTQFFHHYSYAYFYFSNARNITHACEISFTRIPFQVTISESISRSPVNFCRDCVSTSVSARVLITSWVAHNLIPKSHFSQQHGSFPTKPSARRTIKKSKTAWSSKLPVLLPTLWWRC